MAYQRLPMLILLGLSVTAAVDVENSTDTPATCTAVRDDARESATVTCHFSTDVSSNLPVSISVDFYPEGKSSPDTLIECEWETLNDTCEIQKGRYSFSKSPASERDMILDISNVTENYAGRYVCQILSKNKSDTSAPCELTSKGTDGGETVSEASSDTTAIVVGVGVAVVVLIAVAVAAYFLRRRCRSQAPDPPKKPDEESLSGDTPEMHPLQDAAAPAVKPVDFAGIPGSDTPNMADRPEKTAPAVTETSETKAPDSTESPDHEVPNSKERSEPREDKDADAASEGDRLLGADKEGSGDERKAKPPAE